MLLTTIEYANICISSYIHPVHPWTLTIPLNTTHSTIARIREEHKEKVHLFRETIEVEKGLIEQTIRTIHEVYLKEMINSTTNTIQNDIPTVYYSVSLVME